MEEKFASGKFVPLFSNAIFENSIRKWKMEEKFALQIFGEVAQRESTWFATRGPWVQIPSSPQKIGVADFFLHFRFSIFECADFRKWH